MLWSDKDSKLEKRTTTGCNLENTNLFIILCLYNIINILDQIMLFVLWSPVSLQIDFECLLYLYVCNSSVRFDKKPGKRSVLLFLLIYRSFHKAH